MKYIICFLCLFFFTLALKAQNCNCDDNFRFLVEKIKKNYIGYPDKVNSLNQLQFKKFTDSLQLIASTSNSYKCLSLMREWLSFFKDKHIDFGMDFSKLSPDSVRIFFANEEKTTWTETTFKSYLQQNNTILDSIEGIWNYGMYEIGIVKDHTQKNVEFIGFVLKADSARWMPQQIKFKISKVDNQYKTIYFSGGDHSINYPSLITQKNQLDFGFFGKWKRGEKKTKAVSPAKIIVPELISSFKVLDEQTSLLTLASFDIKYKRSIDSLIDSNKNNLAHTKHLIVDVRDNPGGTTSCFEKLIPYLYTNPIHIDGGIVLATEDNIRDCYEKDYSLSSTATKKKIQENNKKLRAHLGELYYLYKPETIKLSKTLKNPERISILINGNTASSGEYFILRAEQSKKVTLFGQNTAGMVDYGEIAITHTPCSIFTLIYPVAKSLHAVKRPLDNIGIAPNISIPESERDWINFVRNYKNE
ncbi:S41 family peptidase [Pedobacter sp. R-06]|uniref:S41 family peptidase n=1 Tax=Pedobacter sp. R-06 TaxID=3404051 RepID=UPI003CF4931D